MTAVGIEQPPSARTLRLWPGVAIVALQWFLWLVLPVLSPSSTAGMVSALGALACGLLFVAWWAFGSRARAGERWGGVALMLATPFAARTILHESVATGGMSILYFVYAVPVLCLAFLAWAALSRRLAPAPRRWAMVAAVALACGGWALVRTDGVTAEGSQFAWRWSPTAEERLLARGAEAPRPATLAQAATADEPITADWPGFRGPRRDGVVSGVTIATDWSAAPPEELWRRPVGPGWSSFAVGGGLLYTQEQRGDDEIVSCHDLATGAPVWRHRDRVRFWESNAGAGPRSTPTLAAGRLYALGATGILNALDAADGTLLWSRDIVADSETPVPTWGFASSPLLVRDLVVIAAGSRLVAYDRATGAPRWLGPADGAGYSSPHRLTLAGEEQIVLLGAAGAAGLAPADGTLLWRHPGPGGAPIVQPALAADGELLVGADQVGMSRLAVTRGGAGWAAEELWRSMRLKPNFSDFVVHRGHAYGFDGTILASIDLADGDRNWKGGRYGNGQLLLLADQDLLLVVSEKGELALVEATPDGFTERARVQAVEGKTWNHPALVGDVLLVRNGEEMAAFRLPAAGG